MIYEKRIFTTSRAIASSCPIVPAPGWSPDSPRKQGLGRGQVILEGCPEGFSPGQGLRIKVGRMGEVEKPALESDFDQYPEKPGNFLNIVTQYDLNYNIKLLI